MDGFLVTLETLATWALDTCRDKGVVCAAKLFREVLGDECVERELARLAPHKGLVSSLVPGNPRFRKLAVLLDHLLKKLENVSTALLRSRELLPVARAPLFLIEHAQETHMPIQVAEPLEPQGAREHREPSIIEIIKPRKKPRIIEEKHKQRDNDIEWVEL